MAGTVKLKTAKIIGFVRICCNEERLKVRKIFSQTEIEQNYKIKIPFWAFRLNLWLELFDEILTENFTAFTFFFNFQQFIISFSRINFEM